MQDGTCGTIQITGFQISHISIRPVSPLPAPQMKLTQNLIIKLMNGSVCGWVQRGGGGPGTPSLSHTLISSFLSSTLGILSRTPL